MVKRSIEMAPPTMMTRGRQRKIDQDSNRSFGENNVMDETPPASGARGSTLTLHPTRRTKSAEPTPTKKATIRKAVARSVSPSMPLLQQFDETEDGNKKPKKRGRPPKRATLGCPKPKKRKTSQKSTPSAPLSQDPLSPMAMNRDDIGEKPEKRPRGRPRTRLPETDGRRGQSPSPNPRGPHPRKPRSATRKQNPNESLAAPRSPGLCYPSSSLPPKKRPGSRLSEDEDEEDSAPNEDMYVNNPKFARVVLSNGVVEYLERRTAPEQVSNSDGTDRFGGSCKLTRSQSTCRKPDASPMTEEQPAKRSQSYDRYKEFSNESTRAFDRYVKCIQYLNKFSEVFKHVLKEDVIKQLMDEILRLSDFKLMS